MPSSTCSGDDSANQVERIIQGLYVKHRELAIRYAQARLNGWYLPDQEASDIAQEGWRRFSRWMMQDPKSKLPQAGEYPQDAEKRLLAKLFQKISDQVIDAIRAAGCRPPPDLQFESPSEDSLHESLENDDILFQPDPLADPFALYETKEAIECWKAELDQEQRHLVNILMEGVIKRTQTSQLCDEIAARTGAAAPTIYRVKLWLENFRMQAERHPILQFVTHARGEGFHL